jgi:shikimate dehydrogenase
MKIPLAGVIGSPIAHSKSPKLHGHWLSIYQKDGYYTPMDVSSEDLQTVLRTLPKAGFRGVNVTLPHKEQALQIADVSTPAAQRIGAANTLTFSRDGKICADNTDAYGFITNLIDGAPQWQPASGPALILGAGGAARAVIVALQDAGVRQILLANRTKARAVALAENFAPGIEVIEWADVPSALAGARLLVNTTSLGMQGHDPLVLDLEHLSSDTVVTDLVYAPLETELLARARGRGCCVVDGLGMLLHQGVPGFEAWFGLRPQVTLATRQAVLG